MNTRHTKMNMEFLVLVLIMPLLLLANELSAPGTGTMNASEDSAEAVQDQDVQSEFNIQTLPGFEVQLLYEVPNEEEGSWVALSVLPNGDLVASDQGDQGLYRISVGGTLEDPMVDIEELTVIPISGAQGLEYAFGRLYANVNGVGLFMLSSENGGEFNVLEYVPGSPDGGGEHGNHAVRQTEDGEGLYTIHGNSTSPAETFTATNPTWDEDILLPRVWDARGHARGRLAPGGQIYRINPEGTEWKMISMGFRNAYDLAYNQQGELFAYDSDMEWDMGAPWYRPTRIVHAVSGSDWGWRAGSGKWKTYYEDSLPPVYNIGPGSPVGVLFGTGAEFPARYQRALYALDWTFGTMRALHLTPEGASYTAEAEEFVSGIPLPLTDAVIGQDGHMYFTTGGRGGQSHLWRVVYTGDESTEAVSPEDPQDTPETIQARELRHRLEAFHGEENPQAIATAWPHLNSEDRFIRHAARVAIEWQPVERWAQRALNEGRPQARITGVTALARMGSPDEHRVPALRSLMELNVAALTPDQQVSYLRAMSLVFQRLGDPNEQMRMQITNKLQPLLPSNDDRVNIELVRTLVYLDDPRVIGKAIALMNEQTGSPVLDWDPQLLERSERYGSGIVEMQENPPPTNKLEYAFMLRNMSEGWTIDQRRDYFSFINEASNAAGGASYTGFLEMIRQDALSHATEEEKEALADIVEVNLAREPDFEINPPQGPGREWTVDEGEEWADEDSLVGANFERGRSLFHAIGCASCHRFSGYGGDIGPDLTTVGNRFDVDEILEDIIHPNEVISDQYSSSIVVMDDGTTYNGLVVERGDNLEIYSQDPDAEPTVVSINNVETVRQTDVSTMPPGLINSLNPQELQDLMAYMLSGGNPDSDVYVADAEEEGGFDDDDD